MRNSYFYIILLSFQIFACSDNNSDLKELSKNTLKNENTNKSILENEESTLKYLKGKSVIFFSVNKQEYTEFINKMGTHTKWEFDIIYNNFKKTAENAIKSLKNKNIKSLYTTDQLTGLINLKNDTTIFNRLNDEYFVGQLFFNGIDSMVIKEGLYKTNELEELIIGFFQLDNDFNISYVPEVSDSFRYYSPDTTVINNNDSI